MPGPWKIAPRLDPKPWGGRGLARLGLPVPTDELIGEALITAGDAVVRDGVAAGQTLASLVAADPLAVAGRRGLAVTGGRPVFPLLVKLIDAAENLSIQVHPDNAAAPADSLGKSEVWFILDAVPGASLYVGLLPDQSPARFDAICREGRGGAAGCLRRTPAVPGGVIEIPPGTVHALGAGAMIYELQQPSDVTYRLEDWGRVDAAGRPRELHLDAGLAVLNPASRPDYSDLVELPTAAGRRQLLSTTPYFALERIALPTGGVAELRAPDSPQVVTCLRGQAAVSADGNVAQLARGESAVLAAAVSSAELTARTPAVLLRAWVPDVA